MYVRAWRRFAEEGGSHQDCLEPVGLQICACMLMSYPAIVIGRNNIGRRTAEPIIMVESVFTREFLTLC